MEEVQQVFTSAGNQRSLQLKGRSYGVYVQTIKLHGSETWDPNAKDKQNLEKNEVEMLGLIVQNTKRDEMQCARKKSASLAMHVMFMDP